MTELERRLARAEESVAAAQRDIDRLQARGPRASGRGASFVAGVMFAAVGSYLTTTAGAQAPKKALTVPFTVENSKGEDILRVYDGGLVVRGHVYVMTASGNIFAGISSDATSAGLSIASTVTVPTGGTAIGISTPALFLGTRKLRGYLELNDESGNKMVEAGGLDEHKGYVLTTPYRASVDPRGNPSVLMGGAGR
jgi:hypothetical protein